MGKNWIKEALGCNNTFPCIQCTKILLCMDKIKKCPPRKLQDKQIKNTKPIKHNNTNADVKNSKCCKRDIPCSSCIDFFVRCFPERK